MNNMIRSIIFIGALFFFNAVLADMIDGGFGIKFGEYFDRNNKKFSSFIEYLPGIFRSNVYRYGGEDEDAILIEYQVTVNKNNSVSSISLYEILSDDNQNNEEKLEFCEVGSLGAYHYFQDKYNIDGVEELNSDGDINRISRLSINDGRNKLVISCHYMQGRVIRKTLFQDSILSK